MHKALTIKVGVLRQTQLKRNSFHYSILPAMDDGLAGALLGAVDNNTTGKFTQQNYEVIDSKLNQEG